MRLTPASKQRLLVLSVLLCGVTAQDRQEGSTSAGAAALKQQHHADSDAVAELIDWIVAAGGEVHASVVHLPGGLRGLQATKDIAEGELVFAVPASLAVPLGDYLLHSASSTYCEDSTLRLREHKCLCLWELAVELVRLQLADPDWNKAWGPYWRSLPPEGDLGGKEAFDLSIVDELQDDTMAAVVRSNTEFTSNMVFPALVGLTGLEEATSVPLGRFRHLASLVGQYSFTLPNASGGADAAYWRYMFPLGDLMNHAGNSNCALGRDFSTGMMYAKAKKAIRAGEEVTHTYSMDLERNDMSLINHFFVQDLQPPRLCALDLPGGHLNGGLFGPDSSFLPRFPDELEEEAERLAARLAAFPTNAAQDAALLAAEGPAALGPAAARLVHFRMLRKQALAHAVAEIHTRLGGRSGAAHGSSAWQEL